MAQSMAAGKPGEAAGQAGVLIAAMLGGEGEVAAAGEGAELGEGAEIAEESEAAEAAQRGGRGRIQSVDDAAEQLDEVNRRQRRVRQPLGEEEVR
jgi:hypothetical protein